MRTLTGLESAAFSLCSYRVGAGGSSDVFSYKDPNLMMRTPPSWPHLALITFQRFPSPNTIHHIGGLSLQQMDFQEDTIQSIATGIGDLAHNLEVENKLFIDSCNKYWAPRMAQGSWHHFGNWGYIRRKKCALCLSSWSLWPSGEERWKQPHRNRQRLLKVMKVLWRKQAGCWASCWVSDVGIEI